LFYFEKEGQDIVESAFYEIDEYDYDDNWNNILEAYRKLIECKKGSQAKFDKLQDFSKIDFLVVPKEYIEIWCEEVNKKIIKNVISFKDFENLNTTNKIIVFLGFFGYNHIKSMLYNPNKISILLYPHENEHYENCFNRFKREIYQELRSAGRKIISEISFVETEKVEDVSDLINRLFDKNEESKINFDYVTNYSTNIIYELTFENDTDIFVLDGNKTVLLKTNQKERNEKVKNLKEGDRIRIYDNSTKEELYKIALDADETGKLNEIESYSKLWKTELLKYSKNFNSLEELLKYLNHNGLSISNELTLKNWINIDSNLKFPQKNKDLLVLKKSINSDMLNNYIKDIIKSRKIYNGIMIALGRDLSDEITNYIKENKKGQILKQFSDNQIQQIVNLNAKERIIKTIKVIENEQLGFNHNGSIEKALKELL